MRRNHQQLKIHGKKVSASLRRESRVLAFTRELVRAIGVCLLTMLSYTIVVSGQTNTPTPAKQDPPVATGGVPGGPSGIFTLYDGSTIRRDELTFSIAYSNYDRDPGILDITEILHSSSSLDHLVAWYNIYDDMLGPIFKSAVVSSTNADRIAGSYTIGERYSSAHPRLSRDPLFVMDNYSGGFLIAASDKLIPLPNEDTGKDDLHNVSSTLQSQAEDLITKGRSLEALGSANAQREAIVTYQNALSILKNTKDSRKSDLFQRIGNLYYALGNYPETLTNYGEALKLDQDDVRTYMNIGVTYRSMGNSVRALDFFQQARRAKRANGNDSEDSLILYNIALAYLDLGENYRAISDFHVALYRLSKSKSQASGTVLEGAILNGLGSAYASLGNSTQAITYYSKALDLFDRSGDLFSESIALKNLGKLNNDLGDYERALSYLFRALPTVTKLGNKRLLANTFLDIGNTYLNQGSLVESRRYYEESLSLFKDIGDRAGESIALNGAGKVRALNLDLGAALSFYERAVELARDNEDQLVVASTLTNMGTLFKAMGNIGSARKSFNEALGLSISLKDQKSQAQNLYELALLDRASGDLDLSRSQIESAISIVEALRADIPNHRLRASYLASVQAYYQEYVDLLVTLHRQRPAQGFDALAFQASERARARNLLDSLVEAQVNVTAGADPTLIERERSLQQTLNRKAVQQMQLLGKPHSAEAAKDIADQIAQLSNQYEIVQSEIVRRSPRYAALTKPRPLNLREIQAQVLDADSLLLSYVLGNERSFLFIVDSTSIAVWELPARKEIESTALQTYDAVRNHYRNRFNEIVRGNGTPSLETDNQFEKLNIRLSNMLLGPVANRLGTKRLLVVAGGALQVVPFASLSVKGRAATARVPLILDHEIVALPSASTLALLRNETRDRPVPPKTLAVFADAVFSPDDPRIQHAAKTTELLKKTYNFPRLYASRWEAEQIGALVPSESKLVLTDFNASRERALQPDLKQYRYLHFATHGILNRDYPDLSGILLSMYDQNGKSKNGILRLNEIYDLDLPVELVVLSGCRTGLGKEVSGEGLTNITRGFMYAGVSRLVVSLWEVDDRVTAALMAVFYKKMLKENLRPAAALRQAQIELLKQTNWKAPYFWAPFVFQGDYR